MTVRSPSFAALIALAALTVPGIAAAQMVPPGCTLVQSQYEPLHLVCPVPPPQAYYPPGTAYYAPPPYYAPAPAYYAPPALILPPLTFLFRFGERR